MTISHVILREQRNFGLKAALNAIAFLSVQAEKDGDAARFHAFMDACTAIRYLMDLNETQPPTVGEPNHDQ